MGQSRRRHCKGHTMRRRPVFVPRDYEWSPPRKPGYLKRLVYWIMRREK